MACISVISTGASVCESWTWVNAIFYCLWEYKTETNRSSVSYALWICISLSLLVIQMLDWSSPLYETSQVFILVLYALFTSIYGLFKCSTAARTSFISRFPFIYCFTTVDHLFYVLYCMQLVYCKRILY